MWEEEPDLTTSVRKLHVDVPGGVNQLTQSGAPPKYSESTLGFAQPREPSCWSHRRT